MSDESPAQRVSHYPITHYPLLGQSLTAKDSKDAQHQ
jgi:hypothetical protein